jgi:hypothetical protein
MKEAFKLGRDWDSFSVYEPIELLNELEEILYINNQLSPKERFIIKTYQAARRELDERQKDSAKD